jgi:hypothetical protein
VKGGSLRRKRLRSGLAGSKEGACGAALFSPA